MDQDPSLILTTHHVSKKVMSGDSEITILQNIHFSVKEGGSVAIVGASGSGKTTLLTLLAGLDLPTSGDIDLLGQRINHLAEEDRTLLRGKNIGFIFQSFQLLPTLTALENVMLPLELQYTDDSEARARSAEWLEKVGLRHRLHHYPVTLSGGEQQRVAIARAFVTNPKIILADEMTGNLDTHTGRLVSDLLFSLNEQNKTTLILVTHDKELAERCAQQMILQEGVLQ